MTATWGRMRAEEPLRFDPPKGTRGTVVLHSGSIRPAVRTRFGRVLLFSHDGYWVTVWSRTVRASFSAARASWVIIGGAQ